MGLDPISLNETARSTSKARIRVKSSALVLTHSQRRFNKNMNMLNIMNRGEKNMNSLYK